MRPTPKPHLYTHASPPLAMITHGNQIPTPALILRVVQSLPALPAYIIFTDGSYSVAASVADIFHSEFEIVIGPTDHTWRTFNKLATVHIMELLVIIANKVLRDRPNINWERSKVTGNPLHPDAVIEVKWQNHSVKPNSLQDTPPIVSASPRPYAGDRICTTFRQHSAPDPGRPPPLVSHALSNSRDHRNVQPN